jgi:hypothetical protein
MNAPGFPLYAMDTCFHSSLGAYGWDARCEMLRELGYDATYLTLWSEDAWADLERIGQTREQFGLEVAGVYWTLDLDDRGGANARFLEALEFVPGGTRFELAIVGEPSSDRISGASTCDHSDPRLRQWLEPILEAASRRELTVSLYPHLDFWLDCFEDATRLARKWSHPQLGTVFCGYHWFAGSGQDSSGHFSYKYLQSILEEGAPWLKSANVCGSTCRVEKGARRCTIETLDRGELDNFAVLGLLREIEFSGPLGFQGYGIGGDVYANLRSSLQAAREMLSRLEARPHWARLRPWDR